MSRVQIAPGVYRDGRTIQIVAVELLEYFGYPDTPQNRFTVMAQAIAAFRERAPEGHIRMGDGLLES
jgi:hypothetical protein